MLKENDAKVKTGRQMRNGAFVKTRRIISHQTIRIRAPLRRHEKPTQRQLDVNRFFWPARDLPPTNCGVDRKE